MEDLKPVIARNITMLRQKAGMTQLELAEMLHYSDKAVSKWERGESIPDVGVLKQIADRFGVTVDALLTQTPVAAVRTSESSAPAEKRTRLLITAVTLMGIAAVALFLLLLLRTWLVLVYLLPAASVVWLVFNSLWFDRRRNFLIISVLMWSCFLTLCATLHHFGLPRWEFMLLGIPGQVIISLCSGFQRTKKP